MSMQQWRVLKRQVSTLHSISGLRKALRLFRAASHANDEEKAGDDTTAQLRFSSSTLFSDVIQFSVTQLPAVFTHHLTPTTAASTSHRSLASHPKFKTVGPLLKTYMAGYIHLLSTQHDNQMTRLLLHTCLNTLVPLFEPFPKLILRLLKHLITLWSTADRSTRIDAFLCVRALCVQHGGRQGILEEAMRGLYLTYVSYARFTSGSNVGVLEFMCNCFPEVDTRILTNHGFLFLDEIEALLDGGKEVLYGCYEVKRKVKKVNKRGVEVEEVVDSKELKYSKGKLVILEGAALPTELVEFTSEYEGARWTTQSGPYGNEGRPDSDGEEVARSRHVSLRVTPNHQMYVQTGKQDKNGNAVWSGTVQRNPVTGKSTVVRNPYRLELARSMLSECRCPPAGPNTRDCDHRRASVRLLACAAAGYVPQIATARTVQCALRLTDTQFPAFIELFGFWLGDGTMAYRSDGSGYDGVSFSQRKSDDLTWLQGMFTAAGLQPGSWRGDKHGRTYRLLILEPAWFAWFDAEFGRKYTNSSRYQPPANESPASLTRSLPSMPSSATSSRRSSLSADVSSSSDAVIDLTAMSDDDEVKLDDASNVIPPPSGQLSAGGDVAMEGDEVEEGEDGLDVDEFLTSGLIGDVDDEQADEKQPPGVQSPPAKHTKSVKWLPEWVLVELSRDEMRLLIQGLWRADGSWAGQVKVIFTSSALFRDQLMHALLHCAYSPWSSISWRAGKVNGYSNRGGTITVAEYSRLTTQQQLAWSAIRATVDGWQVTWAGESSRGGKAACWPSMPRQKCVTRQPYSPARDGRIWCVTITHPDHLIIAQRAERHGGVVTKQSRPIIVHNCIVELYGLDGPLAYQHAFVYIRQLAIHLRNATQGGKAASGGKKGGGENERGEKRKGNKSGVDELTYKAVYNWQFVNCLRAWTKVLASPLAAQPAASTSAATVPSTPATLRPLLYPFVQVCLGVLTLLPSSRYHPLRLVVINFLITLSSACHLYIPLVPSILSLFSSPELTRKPTSTSAKSPDIRYLLKVSKTTAFTRGYQEQVTSAALRSLVHFYTLHSYSLAYPELMLVATRYLRRWTKQSKIGRLKKEISAVVTQLEWNGEWVKERREKLDCTPKQCVEGKIDGMYGVKPAGGSVSGKDEMSPLERYVKMAGKREQDEAGAVDWEGKQRNGKGGTGDEDDDHRDVEGEHGEEGESDEEEGEDGDVEYDDEDDDMDISSEESNEEDDVVEQGEDEPVRQSASKKQKPAATKPATSKTVKAKKADQPSKPAQAAKANGSQKGKKSQAWVNADTADDEGDTVTELVLSDDDD